MSSTYKFEAETERLLELLTHSIYSNKEIFLRELISNASDAIDKARIKSLTDTEYLGTDADFKIRITANKEAGTILLEDNGIGMTKDELIAHLGTIAKSGTKDFIEKLKESKAENNLIGQFGVGFYSVFMVASQVEVTTKSAESSEAHTWISEGKGQFDIIPSDRTSRGTSLLITLKEDEKEYADEWKIRELVRKHSQYVAIPVELQKSVDSHSSEA
jgi:molecular chaperone HtpG